MPVIDIHTHCSPPARDDPLGVAQALRGIPVGKNSVTNYRGLPAVSYHDMTDFDLQQEVCVKAGITGRIISNPFAAEVMTAISSKPAIDVVKHVNDQTAAWLRSRQHRAAWDALWQADVLIEGDAQAQQAVHSELYFLLSSSTPAIHGCSPAR